MSTRRSGGAEPASRDAATSALLSPEAARWRALRGFGAPDRASVAGSVASALRRWREDWSLERGDGKQAGAEGISCVSPVDDAAPWTPRDPGAWWPAGAGWGLWWSHSSAPTQRSGAPGAAPVSALRRALFGEPSPRGTPLAPERSALGRRARKRAAREERDSARAEDPVPTLAAEIALEAWEDLWKRIASAWSAGGEAEIPREAAPPADAWRPWSGALVVEIPWWEGRLALLVAGERVEQLVRDQARSPAAQHGASTMPLTPLWRALARRTARVRAQTQPFELDLGTLAGLRVGDVIRTAQTLDTPLTVIVDGACGAAGALCAGFLGKSGGVRAVELMPAQPARPPPAAGAGAPHPSSDP